FAPDCKESTEDVADGLSEPFGRVLHTRAQAPETTIPGCRSARTAVVETAHHEYGQRNHTPDGAEKDRSRVRRAPVREGHDQPPRSLHVSERGSAQLLNYNAQRTDDVRG